MRIKTGLYLNTVEDWENGELRSCFQKDKFFG